MNSCFESGSDRTTDNPVLVRFNDSRSGNVQEWSTNSVSKQFRRDEDEKSISFTLGKLPNLNADDRLDGVETLYC